jgi:sugar-specific transcriptional regulator TrmB
MFDDYDESQILIRLGLTSLEAKVYLALTNVDSATPKSISLITKIDRANVYRVVTQLQRLNLVEKMIMNPTHFKALPEDEGIRMLLETKDKEYSNFKEKTKELIEKRKRQVNSTPDETNCQFALIPDGKLTERKVAEMINSNEKTHDIIFYWKDFKSNVDEVVEQWRTLLLRGVQVRALVFMDEKERLPKEIIGLKKYEAIFEVRRTLTPPKATITIIDGKQSFISVTPKLTPPGNPGLWINNQTIVSFIQDYFDMNWRVSKTNIP